MVRKLSAYECGIADRAHLRHKIALVAIVILLTATVDLGARDGTKDWVVLENCRLILNPANDGDSFHISAGNEEYIFRLYLVDAPETEGTEPGRLIEQAKYFEITVPQAIEVGESAKAFTRNKLAGLFTVFTRRSDAMGRSKIERLYAFVQTKEGDLGEQLVRNGIARVHGAKAIPPGFSGLQPERQKLQQFEDEAKQEKIGGWGVGIGRVNVRTEKPSAFSMFPAPRPPTRGDNARTVSTAPTRSPTSAQSGAPLSKTIPTGKLDINTATEEELTRIPGVGPAMAVRIISARPFSSADDLKKVIGIGDKKYETFRPYFK
jgi:competence ComEA-like helix-hairpin-helix protein